MGPRERGACKGGLVRLHYSLTYTARAQHGAEFPSRTLSLSTFTCNAATKTGATFQEGDGSSQMAATTDAKLNPFPTASSLLNKGCAGILLSLTKKTPNAQNRPRVSLPNQLRRPTHSKPSLTPVPRIRCISSHVVPHNRPSYFRTRFHARTLRNPTRARLPMVVRGAAFLQRTPPHATQRMAYSAFQTEHLQLQSGPPD
jgi:hypothetical protein